MNKYSSLLGLLTSYRENKVLRIRSHALLLDIKLALKFPVPNALAYFFKASVTKKKSLTTLTTGEGAQDLSGRT